MGKSIFEPRRRETPFEWTWQFSIVLAGFGLIGLLTHSYESVITEGPYPAVIGTFIGYVSVKGFWFFLSWGILGFLISKYIISRRKKV